MKPNISAHITHGEAIFSMTAKKRGLANEPNAKQIAAMKLVALYIFENVRAHFGNKPIFVSSFFRAWTPASQHGGGEAIDMDGDVYPTASNLEIFNYIRKHLQFDQLILEDIKGGKAGWVHCSYKAAGNRNQILLHRVVNGKAVYEVFTEARLKQLLAK